MFSKLAILLVACSFHSFTRRTNCFAPNYSGSFHSTASILRHCNNSGHQVFASPLAHTPTDTAYATIRMSGSRKLTHSSPFLADEQQQQPQKLALVILNSPIGKPPSPLFQQLWSTSSIRICADGGANRLYYANPELIPDLIRGDLDSLSDDVRKFYLAKGVKIERDPNQDNNDLDKALSALNHDDNHKVIVYGAFGGRFDQEMASMQSLYTWSDRFRHKLLLIDDNTCAFLLPAGFQNEIKLPRYGNTPAENILGEGPTCGLIPLGGPCEKVVTSGLRWNLNGESSKFGGLVSTSNHIEEPIVLVECSHPLIFTAEVVSGT